MIVHGRIVIHGRGPNPIAVNGAAAISAVLVAHGMGIRVPVCHGLLEDLGFLHLD